MNLLPSPIKPWPGMKGEKSNWKKEWIVAPLALMAATPVGASTTMRFIDVSRRLCRKVVFPVPAFPVRKRLVPVFSTICLARLSSELFSIALCFIVEGIVVVEGGVVKCDTPANEKNVYGFLFTAGVAMFLFSLKIPILRDSSSAACSSVPSGVLSPSP